HPTDGRTPYQNAGSPSVITFSDLSHCSHVRIRLTLAPWHPFDLLAGDLAVTVPLRHMGHLAEKDLAGVVPHRSDPLVAMPAEMLRRLRAGHCPEEGRCLDTAGHVIAHAEAPASSRRARENCPLAA